MSTHVIQFPYHQRNRMTKNSTSFKPGNQAAKGFHFGRPPENYTDAELVEIGKDMVEYFKKDESACFIQDYIIHTLTECKTIHSVENLYKAAEQRAVFREYYQIMKALCANRISKNAGTPKGLNAGIAHRFLPLYYRDLFNTEVEMKRAGIEETKPTEVHVHMHPDAIVKCE